MGQVEISPLLGIQSFRVFTEGGAERAERHAKKRKEATFLSDRVDVYLQSGQKSAKSSAPGLRRAGEGRMAFRAFSCWDPGRGTAAGAVTGREDVVHASSEGQLRRGLSFPSSFGPSYGSVVESSPQADISCRWSKEDGDGDSYSCSGLSASALIAQGCGGNPTQPQE